MDVCHRIVFNPSTDREFYNLVQKLDLKITLKALGSFEVCESDPVYPEVGRLVAIHKVADFYDTNFSDEEILSAKWLFALPTHELAYPQPKSSFFTSSQTYSMKCSRCGIYQQVAPFRIEKEVNLHGKDFTMLIWAAHLFAHQRVVDLLQKNKITGFEPWKVLIHKTSKEARSLMQLYITSITKPGYVTQTPEQTESCSECGTWKHPYPKLGKLRFKKDTFDEVLDMQLAGDWFGRGKIAYHPPIVSNKFAKLVLLNKLNGLRLKVVEEV